MKTPQVALFFLERDMHPGTKMNLHFTTSSNTATFLPRKTAESIPFSSDKLPEILDQFSVKPESAEADIIKETIEECEKPALPSLEKNIQAVSTEVEKGTSMQKYTILPGVKKLAGDKSIACHKQNYVYAVFYCHATKTTRAYIVPLEGADGVNAKAVAVCHTDTSEWNPKHLAFQVLKVKPGTIPICHFLPSDHIVWVPNLKST
ncbi:hypothetical protein M0R45_012155 [Rubus argutus]|uniref:BURP domain-containing protein n=1 Tax=Rubus argutus TaxID=59490 RepID=A0AAW1YCR2_RUBAR